MRKIKNLVCPPAPVLALLALLLGSTAGVRAANPVPAPGWQLQDPAGKTVRLSDYKNRVIILNFWATWCPPCVQEIPGFVALQKRYAEKGLVVIGLSLDEGEPQRVSAFMRQARINYPVVMADDRVIAHYGGFETVPTTFIINRDGNIVASHSSYTDAATIEAEIKPLF